MENGACSKEYWELINDYIDGRLSGRKLTKMRSHLRSCSICAGAEEELRSLRLLVSTADIQQPSDMFWDRCIDVAIASVPKRRPLIRRFWKPAVAFAALSVVTVAVLLAVAPVPVAPVVSEVPNREFIMEHAGFVAAQPLANSSHHILTAARCASAQTDSDASILTSDPEDQPSKD